MARDQASNDAVFVNEAYVADGGDAHEMRSSAGCTVEGASALTASDNVTHTSRCATLFGLIKMPIAVSRVCVKSPALLVVALGYAAVMQGLSVNGLIPTILQSLELRFALTSKQSGFIPGAYDLGSLLIVIPISYLGDVRHVSKTRVITVGLLLMAVGNAMIALPHFLTDLYLVERYNKQQPLEWHSAFPIAGVAITNQSSASIVSVNNRCDVNRTTLPLCAAVQSDDSISAKGADTDNDLSHFYPMFVVGEMLCGIGAAPLITIGVTLIDDNCTRRQAPMYIGIFQAMFVLGPALGYMIGAFAQLVYVDFDVINNGDLTVGEAPFGLTPDSPIWLGAWWLGMIVASAGAVLAAVTVSFFPSMLLDADSVQRADHKSTAVVVSSSAERLPGTLWRLMCNPLYMLVSLANAMDAFIVGGLAAFMPKYIGQQFSMSQSDASKLTGIIVVIFGSLGTLIGGFVSRHLKVSRKGNIMMCVIAELIVVPTCFLFLATCPTELIYGVNYAVRDVAEQQQHFWKTSSDLDAFECNAACACSTVSYDPVCGANGLIYFSPCHAGCTGADSALMNYTDCRCVGTDIDDANWAVPGRCKSGEVAVTADDDEAVITSCHTNLIVFIVLMSITTFCLFFCLLPTTMCTLRAVPKDVRSLAIGFQTIFGRILGSINSPVIYGVAFDSACHLWSMVRCSESFGNCLSYDNWQMSINLFSLTLAIKVANISFYVAAFFVNSRNCVVDEPLD